MRLLGTLLAAALTIALGGCGDTLQEQPLSHNLLESLIEAPFPVYWVGSSFSGLNVSEATHDPGDAYTVQYGNCLVGGQAACVRPLRVVSSPDNSFLPGGGTPARQASIRGVTAVIAQAGKTIEIPTAGVVLDIYASSPRLALIAAETVVPINEPSAPRAPLPTPLPNTGFGEQPLPTQVPAPLRPLPHPHRGRHAKRASAARRGSRRRPAATPR